MGSSSSKPSVQSSSSNRNPRSQEEQSDKEPEPSYYPKPTGHEYDEIDKLAAGLPNVIDDESRQQVDDYKQACDGGKGPMVACYATAEFISLFERRHREAAELYRNVCFRPTTDKSPNRQLIDGTMSYPAGCFNLAKMLMTGKGGIPADRYEAYQLLDRACRGGHGGACYLQAQSLLTRPGSLDSRIPHDPRRAAQLYQHGCDTGDSLSCFTLATMLLRGDRVSKAADNVSPQEARGMVPIQQRENEEDRVRDENRDNPYVVQRDPVRAEKLLRQACEQGGHVTSCHNLVVMYLHGDDGVPVNPELAERYKKLTNDKIGIFGGL
jgi:TPR repeat protein